jgi:acetoin utilization protein AcuB
MLIKDFMTPNPITVDEGISVLDAAELMKRHGVRRFPVMKDNKLVGMVTDRDVRSASPSQVITFDEAERGLFPELYALLNKITIRDIMARNVVTVRIEKTIITASLIMLKHRISGLPVVDDQQKLVGIQTRGDIFKFMLQYSAGNMGKTLLAFSLEDRPDIGKDVVDVIRAHGGRIASLMSFVIPGEEQRRLVYIRIMDDPSVDLAALKKELDDKFDLLYMIEDDVTIP